jgi:hypothetical protein
MKCKDAGVRNTEEKQHLLDRKVSYFQPGEIAVIKSPNPKFGEIHIPNNEDKPGNRNSRKESTPGLMEIQLWVKGK